MQLRQAVAYEAMAPRGRGATSGRTPFCLYFLGPGNPILPQAMYTLRSGTITFDNIFIVPVGRNESGIDYEAVFN
jgi:hypothetical protein